MAILSISPLSIAESGSNLSAGVLEGLPLLDQLHEPTHDQLADENARMNCVFTSFAMVGRKIGHPLTLSGDDVKDHCSRYGQGYTGGADATVVASDGCLDKFWGIHCDTVHFPDRSNMLNACKVYADKGIFCEITIPSAWNSQPSQPGYNPNTPNFWTHACVYCGYFGDTHVIANPWGGFLMYYSSADIMERLCYLKIYPITPVAEVKVVNALIDLDKDANGNIVGAHQHEHPEISVGEGIAKAINKNNQLDHNLLDLGGTSRRGERPFGPRTATILSNGQSPDSVYTYSQQFGVVYALGCPDLAIILATRIAAADMVVPKPDYTTLIGSVQGALNALDSALRINGEVK